jgi:hypothetical protein
LARRYGVNPKTIAKWKARTSVADLRTGPKETRSTVLTVEEEAVVVAFRRHTLLPLDDCLYALQKPSAVIAFAALSGEAAPIAASNMSRSNCRSFMGRRSRVLLEVFRQIPFLGRFRGEPAPRAREPCRNGPMPRLLPPPPR